MFLESVLEAYAHKRKVVIAPLNWGLGHATRCIPIIDWFIANGTAVVIASDGIALTLLRQEYPSLPYYELPPYNIRYARHYSGLKIASQALKILRAKLKEQRTIQAIVDRESPDLIISDNRLGVKSDHVESIVISHQIQIMSPIRIVDGILRKLNLRILNAFDECWIPDYKDSRLAGSLSKSSGLKQFKYLGPISRLEKTKATDTPRILVLLSGPEPQRTLLEAKLIDLLYHSSSIVTIVRGSNLPRLDIDYNQYTVIDLADKATLQELLDEATLVISRTGYTTVMDLDKLGKQAILIPTPGQPEQEYLGRHLVSHSQFTIVEQKDLTKRLLALILEKGMN